MKTKERIERARKALEPYEQDGNTTDLDITDLLCDLMHLAGEYDTFCFSECKERAYRHYLEEVETS